MGADNATPITVGEFLAKLSEFYPYGDEPPRLCAALNDARTDAPPGTTFDATGAALEHKAQAPYTAATVTDVLSWVQRRLDQGTLFGAWMSQLACTAQWLAPEAEAAAEEIWAQTVAELFLGTTYSGPLQLYNMGAPFIPRNAAGKLPKMKAGETWEQYCFRRIEKRYPRQLFHMEGAQDDVACGAYDLQSWDNPAPQEYHPYDDDDTWQMHDNTDPAAPIGIACQHMTTYGALLRGVPLDWLGDATNNRVGFMASDACAGLAAFGGPQPAGVSPYGGAEKLVTPPSPPGKWVSATPALMQMDTLVKEGIAPGTIIVLDTDSGGKKPGKGSVRLYLSDYEKQDHVHREVLKEYFYTRPAVGSSDFAKEWESPDRKAPAAKYVEKIDAQIAQNEKRIADQEGAVAKKKDDLAKAKKQEEIFKLKADLQQKEALLKESKDRRPYLEGQKKLAGNDKTSAYDYTFNEQLPGNHIWFVLRVHKDKKSFQAFDVSSGGSLAHLTPSKSEAILKRSGEDIHVDGYKLTGLGAGEGKQFCGIGILPKTPNIAEQAAFAREARTIGLARLVISERTRTIGKKVYPGLADKKQILYVSPLVPMYGPSPGQNYSISKLMWAIRNTPGFTDLQVWWCVCAPQGLLAKSMWAEGSRAMTLRTFIETMAASEDWNHWSFLLPDYFPGTDRAAPAKHLIAEKRKKIRKGLYWELHYRLHVVVANEGDKDAAGKVSNVCRYKNGEGNANRKASPMDPPEPLTSVLKNLAWDKAYLRSDLEPLRADVESGTPAMFKVEPPPSDKPAV